MAGTTPNQSSAATPAQTGRDDDAAPKLASSKYVVYIGPYGERIIDKSSWDAVNVKDQKKVSWNQANGWSVPVDQFTDDALNYCDKDDEHFVIRDVEVPRT